MSSSNLTLLWRGSDAEVDELLHQRPIMIRDDQKPSGNGGYRFRAKRRCVKAGDGGNEDEAPGVVAERRFAVSGEEL